MTQNTYILKDKLREYIPLNTTNFILNCLIYLSSKQNSCMIKMPCSKLPFVLAKCKIIWVDCLPKLCLQSLVSHPLFIHFYLSYFPH